VETRSNYVMVGAVTLALLAGTLLFIVWLAGLSNKSTKCYDIYFAQGVGGLNKGSSVSFSGVIKNGTGAVSGVDNCGADTNVAGITIPAEESVEIKGGGAGFVPTGNPPYDSLKTFSQDSANSRLAPRYS